MGNTIQIEIEAQSKKLAGMQVRLDAIFERLLNLSESEQSRISSAIDFVEKEMDILFDTIDGLLDGEDERSQLLVEMVEDCLETIDRSLKRLELSFAPQLER